MNEKKKRGFAALSPEQRKVIASKGGKTAHEKGTAHKFKGEEAREAGRKGGIEAHRRGTAHRFTGKNVIEKAKEFLNSLNPVEPLANNSSPEEIPLPDTNSEE